VARKFDILFRIETEVSEYHLCLYIKVASEAPDADCFAFKFSDSLELRMGNQHHGRPRYVARDKLERQSLYCRHNSGYSAGTIVNVSVDQRGDRYVAGHKDVLSINPVVFQKTFALR